MIQMTELLRKYRLSYTEALTANGDTILHLVVEDEDFTEQETIEILEKLLNHGLDPNSRNKKEETVLHLAIKNRARNVIDFLLERKVDMDNSAALYLIENEYSKLLELENQSQISSKEKQKLEIDSASFLEWMITKGLNIDRSNRCGQSALFLAVDYSLHHLLTVLLKYTENINYVGYEKKRTLLHMILENEAKTRWSPSYNQRYGSSVVKILLERGVSPESADTSLNTALHLAIANYEDFNIVQMLIDHTTNLNHKNRRSETPLSVAICEGLGRRKRNTADDYLMICQTLILKGADVNEETQSLHIFAEETSSYKFLDKEEIKLFEMLIRNGCNVNAKNLHGKTPLHIAAAGCNVAVVKKLVENGAHINPRDDDGKAPLHFIALCNRNYTEIAKLLIEHGANVNAKDYKSFTPLHEAAGEQEVYYDNCDGLKLLLEYGADFCALSDGGYSVLHMSVLKYENHCCFLDDDESYYEPLRLEEVSKSVFFSCSGPLSAQLKFLLIHWVKLYAAQFKCGIGYPFKTQCIEDGLKYYPGSRTVYEDCTKEIKILKNTFIDNNRTSIYAFLHMNLESRRAHIYSEKLQELVHSPSQLEKQFPQYRILILSSYNETIRRKSLMEPAKIAWIKLIKTYLGDLCIEHIFISLSNAELYNLIEASEIDYSR